jgi:serine protease Do
VKGGVMRYGSYLLFGFLLLITAASSSAKIYQYQKDGTWFFTDSPPADMPEDSREMVETGRPVTGNGKEGAVLLDNYPARNAIEKAAKATVAIKTSLGYGSGFFISPDGHILTNKHVIRLPKQQVEQFENYFNQLDRRAETIDEQLSAEQKRIDAYQERLDNLKQTAAGETDPSRRKAYEDECRYRKGELDRWKADYLERQRAFQSQFDQYESKRGNFDYDRSVAALSQTFTVILVDDTELYAHLLAVSENYDLALLKVDAWRTPMLQPATAFGLAQGDPVYAIGNPANLRNTVTSGIFSGFEGNYIQTNAQISPGNSGGPLIDPDGKVLGINTKKKSGPAFEGLGFAIPIQAAFDEFGVYLP